jgi:hypothetical protein
MPILKYMKTCTNSECKQINPQPFTEFHKRKAAKGGLSTRCRTCDNIRTNGWAIKNRERSNAAKDRWRFANQEQVTAQIKRWEENNPGKKAVQVRKYQATKLNATPKWLTKEQRLEMQAFYVEAARLTKETGIPHEVDHIEPLQGKNVRGLHVPWNLQILQRPLNRRKGNKQT